MSRPQHIVFVCMNQRPPGAKPSCRPAGSEELMFALREQLDARPELMGKVRVAASSCLGPCEEGPHVVVYPDDIWYAQAKPEDAKRIFDALVAGEGGGLEV